MAKNEIDQFIFRRSIFYWLRNRLYKQLNIPVDDFGESSNSDRSLDRTKAHTVIVTEKVTGRKLRWQEDDHGE